MLQIILYKYNGKYNALPKTLGEGTTIEGLLRDDCIITAPMITIRTTDKAYNYAYIPVFGKYYFIERTEITSASTSRLTMREDVLQTFANEILEGTGIVTHSDTPNKYVSDRNVKYDERPQFTKVSFPNTNLFSKDGTIMMITIKGNV